MIRFLIGISIFSSVLLLASCKNSVSKEVNNTESSSVCGEAPYLSVDKVLNFGIIQKSKTSSKEFILEFTNTGNSPLVIFKTDVTCGCIKTVYSSKPIERGEKGYIYVTVNLANQKGHMNKPIIIKSNAQNNLEIVRVKGVIK
ncbi:MAG: DUF1573 domain-containing protein [Phascolarctobacterium sp.]